MRVVILLAFILALTGCSELQFASHVAKSASGSRAQEGNFKVGKPYKVDGKWYYPQEAYEHEETGIASWYGPGFHGKRTANGEIFDTNELTAAHRTLQMPSLVRVTNLDNGKSVVVRINDRGPFKRSRVIDVSQKAAELLGFKHIGTAKVKLQVLSRESMEMAQAARRGESTASYQTAAADSSENMESFQTAAHAPEPVTREVLDNGMMNGNVPVHAVNGAYYPDPVVTNVPVTPTGIYVQAGSFTVHGNADALAQQLQAYSHAKVVPAHIGGREFYRVRLGPVTTVDDADRLLARLVENGYKDTIVVVE